MDMELPRFPFRRTCPFDPPAEYADLRAREPVSRVALFDGAPCWLVTRYDDVRAVAGDVRFSSETTNPGFPEVFEGRRAVGKQEQTFIGMDPPDHDRHRLMLTSTFMVKKAEAMRPAIAAMVDGLIDDLLAAGPPADLVAAFALPIPTAVICNLLGVPVEDHAFFQDRASARLTVGLPPEAVAKATGELMAYLGELVERKEADPGDDIISRLLATQVAAGHLSKAELADMARLLLIAGHDSTAQMISLSVALLLEHPDQLAVFRADPEVVPGAVEELLRYLSAAQLLIGRVATEDLEVGGTVIRAGEGVRAMLASANRDERAFPDPDRLDLRRDARHHVAFGYGIHQCLGQPYARVEMQVALETLFRRIPTLRLAVPVDDLPFKHESAIHGLHRLPVEW
ncbi:MAG TPA: cytochrome P450 [Acidimicrobiia bacterium]|nr:cytochrome P450 [Acidimicrobiia bacterium]